MFKNKIGKIAKNSVTNHFQNTVSEIVLTAI